MYFGSFCFRSEFGFLNCDDICMCGVNKQFEPFEFVFDSVYVNLKYYEISLTFTYGVVCLCGVCSHAVVLGLSVRLSWYPMWMRWLMRVLLFVFDVSMLRECEGARMTTMRV